MFLFQNIYNLQSDLILFFFVGTSTPTGKFFGTCAVLASHEDGPTWASILKFVHDDGNVKPTYNLGDGAKAIHRAL